MDFRPTDVVESPLFSRSDPTSSRFYQRKVTSSPSIIFLRGYSFHLQAFTYFYIFQNPFFILYTFFLVLPSKIPTFLFTFERPTPFTVSFLLLSSSHFNFWLIILNMLGLLSLFFSIFFLLVS